jgi:hypothetical protein
MSRSYTSYPCACIGVLWDCFTFFMFIVINVAMVMLLWELGSYVFYVYVVWLVCDNLLLRYLGPYGIIFTICVLL